MDATELGAWLKVRLTDERGERDWRATLARLIDEGLSRPVERWLPLRPAMAVVEAHRTEPVVDAWSRAMSRGAEDSLSWLKSVNDPPVQLFSESAVAAAQDMVARPGLVPEAWIRHWFAQPAAEALLSDTLFRSLRDFASVVPRLVKTLLPGFLGRFARLGGSVVGTVAEELERRLEPEIRKFVDGGSRVALQRAADFAVRHAESEQSVAARRSFVAFVGGRPLAETVGPAVVSIPDLERVLQAAGRHWVADGTLHAHLRSAVERWYERHGAQPVATVLDAYGLGVDLPLDAWADASWPAVRTLFETDAAGEWLQGLAAEILNAID
jgi:hypothetical protein